MRLINSLFALFIMLLQPVSNLSHFIAQLGYALTSGFCNDVACASRMPGVCVGQLETSSRYSFCVAFKFDLWRCVLQRLCKVNKRSTPRSKAASSRLCPPLAIRARLSAFCFLHHCGLNRALKFPLHSIKKRIRSSQREPSLVLPTEL